MIVKNCQYIIAILLLLIPLGYKCLPSFEHFWIGLSQECFGYGEKVWTFSKISSMGLNDWENNIYIFQVLIFKWIIGPLMLTP